MSELYTDTLSWAESEIESKESKATLADLPLDEQAKLIFEINQYLWSYDMRSTDHPYFKFSCTIDQDWDLVLNQNRVKLSWIDLKNLQHFLVTRNLLRILTKFFERNKSHDLENPKQKSVRVLRRLRDNISRLFRDEHSHIIWKKNKFVLAKKDIDAVLNSDQTSNGWEETIVALEEPEWKAQLDSYERDLLVHINHMMWSTRKEYFSMKHRWTARSKLYLNEKWCRYLSGLLLEIISYLEQEKSFMDIWWLFKKDTEGEHILYLLKQNNILADYQILRFLHLLKQNIDGGDLMYLENNQGTVWLIHDLLYTSHFSYHTNWFDFYDYQLAPHLSSFKRNLENNEWIQSLIVTKKNEHPDSYVLFHDVSDLKNIVSAWLKVLRWKDTVRDIFRWRSILDKEVFDRTDQSSRSDLIARISTIYQWIEKSLETMCTDMEFTVTSVHREFNNKYQAFYGEEEDIIAWLSDKRWSRFKNASFETGCKKKKNSNDFLVDKSMIPSVRKKIFWSISSEGEHNDTLSDDEIVSICSALQSQKVWQIEGYEDMKVVYTISGNDGNGNPITFFYEHMLVFSDYSNEHPSASHTMKLDPWKIVTSVSRDMYSSSQSEYYRLSFAWVRSYVAEAKLQKVFLENPKNKEMLYKNIYPYTYIQQEYNRNQAYTLDEEKKLSFVDLNLDDPKHIALIHTYLAEWYKESLEQKQLHMFVRTGTSEERLSWRGVLNTYDAFNSVYGKPVWNISIWSSERIEDLVISLKKEDFHALHQTIGNLRRQLDTCTIPIDGKIWIVLGKKVYRISVPLASYMVRMMTPEHKESEKFVIDIKTGDITKKTSDLHNNNSDEIWVTLL